MPGYGFFSDNVRNSMKLAFSDKLFLYGKIRVKQNRYSGIYYIVYFCITFNLSLSSNQNKFLDHISIRSISDLYNSLAPFSFNH